MRFTWTRVLNGTGFLVTSLALVFDFQFASIEVGAIALLVWSIANLFTEGGLRERRLSLTVVTNGVGAALGLATAAGWIEVSSEQVTQISLIVFQALNLFTEGGIAGADGERDAGPPIAVFLLVATLMGSAGFLASCTHRPTGPAEPVQVEAIVTIADANEALVKAQAIRRLARDAVAAARVTGAADDELVADFDRYDKEFTRTYRILRALVNAGAIDSFRGQYVDFLRVLTALGEVASKGGLQ